MSEKSGREFITHEFDEAISIQKLVLETGKQLSESHPEAESRRLIKSQVQADERNLRELQRLGKPYGATGKVEDVAEALASLARDTVKKAGEAPSEAYEAHAVLLLLRRKQQDAAAAVLKIARELKETSMRDSAREMLREGKKASQDLADSLASFAVSIASRDAKPATSAKRG